MIAANALTAQLGMRPGFQPQEYLSSGLSSLDKMIQGFPRGAISELVGPASSGRATVLHSLLACSTSRHEVCAYIDTDNAFDPCSAAASGVILEQLIWVRGNHDIEHAFKAADLLLHAGGFGVVVLDLAGAAEQALRRVPLSYWYRFRRALENTPTILALIEREAQAKSCASLILELTRKKAMWSGAPGFHLLQQIEIEAVSRKPVRTMTASIQAGALG